MNLEQIEEENTRDIAQMSGSADESDYSGYISCIDKNEEDTGGKRIKNEEDTGGKRIKLEVKEATSYYESEKSQSSIQSSLDESRFSASRQNSTDIDIAKMCSSEQPSESTRMPSEDELTLDNRSVDQTYLDSSNFKSILLDDDQNSDVSIISKLVNLICTIHSEFKKISPNGINILSCSHVDKADEAIMRALCCMKTVRDLASTLCSVHEAVGLSDLKVLSYAFKDEVDDTWTFMKTMAVQTSKPGVKTNFKQNILRLLELVGGLSLAAVDHIVRGNDNLYINENFQGELSVYFLKHQNRFLSTMLDEAKCTVENGIEEMKKFQLSSNHEMSEDLVDGVMNILTSMGTLFQQCQDLSLVYLKGIEQCSGQYFAEECFHLRSILTDIIDYNENIGTIIEKSKHVAKNCDALEEFLDIPIVLADITKCICNSAGALIHYTTSHKCLDEVLVDALYESLEKFVFSGKTVRVGVSMLVQEIEKDLNVDEDCSIIPFVHADTSFGKRGSLCPMNTSEIDVGLLDTQLKSKFSKCRRSSLARPEQYISRYMDL